MFGLKKEEAEKLIDDKLCDLREEFRKKFRDLGAPPDAKEFAADVLRQIMNQVDPKEFLNNLLLSKGLTLEALVRQAVSELLRAEGAAPEKEEIIEAAAAKLADSVENNLDLDEIQSRIAEKAVLKGYVPEKTDILEGIVEKVSEAVWDELDLEELYPHIGEKVVDRLKAAKD